MTDRRAVAIGAAGVSIVLAACGLTLKEQPGLELGCQLRQCVCQSVTVEPFRKRATATVLWRQNGDAYCPDGFVLRPAAEQ